MCRYKSLFARGCNLVVKAEGGAVVEQLQAFESRAQGGDPTPHAKIVTVKKSPTVFNGLSKEELQPLCSTIYVAYTCRKSANQVTPWKTISELLSRFTYQCLKNV